MYKSIAAILIFLAGWTLASNLLVLMGGSLNLLMLAGPAGVVVLIAIFLRLPASRNASTMQACCAAMDHAQSHTTIFIVAAILVTTLLKFDWKFFWSASVILLSVHCALAHRLRDAFEGAAIEPSSSWRWIVVATMIAVAVLVLFVNRPDADDAFYVGVAAFAHAHPHAPLLAIDPMHGEPNWPLLFPSYRFASYELLAAALAKLLGLSAMDVMYRVLPPFGAAFVVVSVFFLCHQLAPRRWLMVGLATIALGIILGECHTSLGNFMFVRIFQGKSIYVSAIMPLIFALTFRYALQDGNPRDMMLLACAQIAAIGISNFGMLAAPLAGGTALAAVALTAPRTRYLRLAAMACTLLIPLPCLLYVAFASHGSPNISLGANETAQAAWLSVFGQRQQYLVALLLLASPALAPNPRTRAWLAAPPLILLGILLNPWLAGLISHYITTAPVYWRVTWCFPVIAYMAWGICLVGERLRCGPAYLSLGAVTAVLLALSTMFSVLRPGNGVSWHFAGLQIPVTDYDAANQAVKRTTGNARVLAPETVSDVIARFEDHPRLILVRDMYIPVFQQDIGKTLFAPRLLLQGFVNGTFQDRDAVAISVALHELDVGTVVTEAENTRAAHLLAADGYTLTDTFGPYAVWRLTTNT